MEAAPKVLIVEDEFLIAEYFAIIVGQLGYEVCGLARTADEAVMLAAREKPAVVIMDVRLAGERDGVEAAEEIRAVNPVPIIFVTASRELQTAQRTRHHPPGAVLTKPVVQQHIQAALAEHCPLPR